MEEHLVKNRLAPRYSCDMPGKLEIFCPEMTFSPRPIVVRALDLSMTGGRLVTREITNDYYLILIKEIRHVKLEVELPDQRLLTVRGRIVWVEFSPKKMTSLAIMFHPLNPKNSVELEHLLLQLEKDGFIVAGNMPRPVPAMGLPR